MDRVEYNYFFKENITVPKTWENHVQNMLQKFDKELRIKWLPKPLSNFIIRLQNKNKIKEIKSSFGELKVIGDFSPKFKQIIKETKKNVETLVNSVDREVLRKLLSKVGFIIIVVIVVKVVKNNGSFTKYIPSS